MPMGKLQSALRLRWKRFLFNAKQRGISLKKRSLALWSEIPVKKREFISKTSVSLVNYGWTAFLLAVPTYFGLSVFIELRFIYCIFSWLCLLPVLEHYYVWFRDSWRGEILPPQ